MNFKNFMNDKMDSVFEKEIRSGADVGRELGISRVGIKKITARAISKMYNAVEDMVEEKSPLKVLLQMCQMLNIENDIDGMKLAFKNLSNEQKTKVLDDVKKNYPSYIKALPFVE